MGISIILLLLSILAFVIIHRAIYVFDWEGDFLPNMTRVIAALSILVMLLLFILILFLWHIPRESAKAGAVAERSKLQRLLQENYNSDNLVQALDFNVLQRKAAVANKSWLTYCYYQCFDVDTVPIPDLNYRPSQEIILKE